MSGPRPMVGHLLAFVVFVDGPPGSPAAFSGAEKTAALREVYLGVGLLRHLAESWAAAQVPPVNGVCHFTVVSRSVSLTRDPATLTGAAPSFGARDQLWLSEALSALGFSEGNVMQRHEKLRKALILQTFLGLGIADACPVFVTKYPCSGVAHAALGMVVINWPEIAAHPLTKNNVDGVVAHEIGHAFGAPDEYGKCNRADRRGPFNVPNTNCVLPAGAAPQPHVRCLMDRHHHVLCPQTPLHWGWRDADHDRVVDLAAPATIHLPERTARAGDLFVIKGRNVWDARAVAFGNKVTDAIDFVALDSILVTVPANASGEVNVSLVTRAGAAIGSVEDTAVTVLP